MATYDQILVISDLHLGGIGDRQAFHLAKRFENFIREINPSDQLTALVINGDFVDFLAEPQPTYFDTHKASEKLDRMAADPSFKRVFEALRAFVSNRRHRLVFVLGNHDVELALPAAQDRLVTLLTDDDESKIARIQFAFDGTGWVSEVASRKLLCLHGNEFDPWNRLDYAQLRQVILSQKRGASPEPWVPNGGTQMVIDVINGLKESYPMVEVLKPEGKAVLPLLFALNPGLAASKLLPCINASLGLPPRQSPKAQVLNANPSADAEEHLAMEYLEKIMDEAYIFPLAGPDLSSLTSSDLLAHVIKSRAAPPSLPPARYGKLTLSARRDQIIKILEPFSPSEALRLALQYWLASDGSFDIAADDACLKNLLTDSGTWNVDIVAAGHTHLRRFRSLKDDGLAYYNTGTWTRVIQITPASLSDSELFKSLLSHLRSSSFEMLDAASVGNQKLVLSHPSALRVRRLGGHVEAVLCNVSENGSLAPMDLTTRRFAS